MELIIDGVAANLEGWKRAKLEKALLASYNEMCDEMNSVILPMYNHIWDFCMGNDNPSRWSKAAQAEYETCENELSQDVWSHILQTKYGYRYSVSKYYLTNVQERKVDNLTVQVTCDLHISLVNVGE